MNGEYHLPIPSGGIFTKQQCQRLAKQLSVTRKIVDMYDHNRDGYVDTLEVGKMLCDCYRSMNKNFMPTATDIAGYCRQICLTRVFDKSNRGKVSMQDIQQLIIKYFHAPQREMY